MHLTKRDLWFLIPAAVLLVVFAVGLWPLALPLAVIVLAFGLAIVLFNLARGRPPTSQP